MSTLTQKQELFCLSYIETGNASEAYRQSYSVGKMKPETINRSAKELMDNRKIAARIEELQAPVVKRAQITLEGHLDKLQEIRDAALDAEQYPAAITAETNRGKAAGLYVERVESVNTNYVVDSKPMSVDEWKNEHKSSGDHKPGHSTH